MGLRDTAVLALLAVNVLLILGLLIWWTRGQRRGPLGPNGRWRHLWLFYVLLLATIVEMTIVGVPLAGLPN